MATLAISVLAALFAMGQSPAREASVAPTPAIDLDKLVEVFATSQDTNFVIRALRPYCVTAKEDGSESTCGIVNSYGMPVRGTLIRVRDGATTREMQSADVSEQFRGLNEIQPEIKKCEPDANLPLWVGPPPSPVSGQSQPVALAAAVKCAQELLDKTSESDFVSNQHFIEGRVVRFYLARFRKELGENMKVIGTGGLVELIAKETPVIQFTAPWLTLDGLRMVWEMNA